MRISISGRRLEVTDALREHVNEGVQRIRHHFDRVIDVEVILDVEKRRHLAEVNLRANGLRINAKEESGDMYASIDSALEKIDRQVGKHKRRIQRHKPRISRDQLEYAHQVIEIAEADHGADQQATAEAHRVIHREKLPLNPMTIDEAVLQLDLLEDTFLVFSNAGTQQLNVLYAREDGTYGLIEPQF